MFKNRNIILARNCIYQVANKSKNLSESKLITKGLSPGKYFGPLKAFKTRKECKRFFYSSKCPQRIKKWSIVLNKYSTSQTETRGFLFSTFPIDIRRESAKMSPAESRCISRLLFHPSRKECLRYRAAKRFP